MSTLYPYSFVLRNNSPRAILAYAARWVTTDAQGRTQTHDLVEGSESAAGAQIIGPFSDQLVLPISKGVVTNLPTQLGRTLQTYSSKAAITMSLETVVLDDGLALGPDSGSALQLIRARTDARLELASGVINAWNAGGESAVFEYLTAITATNSSNSLLGASRQRSSEDAYATFLANQRAQYARTYAAIAKSGVPTLIQIAQKALSRMPLTIHR